MEIEKFKNLIIVAKNVVRLFLQMRAAGFYIPTVAKCFRHFVSFQRANSVVLKGIGLEYV